MRRKVSYFLSVGVGERGLKCVRVRILTLQEVFVTYQTTASYEKPKNIVSSSRDSLIEENRGNNVISSTKRFQRRYYSELKPIWLSLGIEGNITVFGVSGKPE